MNKITATIKGRSYTIHLDQGGALAVGGAMFRMTGVRKADGVLLVRKDGTMATVGLTATEHAHSWEITDGLGDSLAEVLAAAQGVAA